MINNNTRFGRIARVLLFLILILSACTTATPKKEILKSSEPAIKLEPILSIDAINKKISILDDLLTNNKVQEKDRVIIANLISDYHRIKALSQGDQSQNDYKEIILTLFSNLSLLDENYFLSKGPDADEIYDRAASDLNIKKQSIFKKYIAKDYKSVISECNELENIFGKDSMMYDTGILLALSLAKDGRLSEAITTGDRVINEMEGRPDLIQLRAGLIQWRLDTGKKENAFKEYQKLIENMNEKQSILDKVANRVDSQNKKITEKQQYQENLNNNKKEGIETATKLIKEEDYESAITILDNLQNGSDNNPDIKKQKDIAIEKLINKERNRAAKIFLTAKKTNDVKKKEDLLLSAKNILNGLIEKYPSAGMIDKLRSNLDSVNDELSKIGKQ